MAQKSKPKLVTIKPLSSRSTLEIHQTFESESDLKKHLAEKDKEKKAANDAWTAAIDVLIQKNGGSDIMTVDKAVKDHGWERPSDKEIRASLRSLEPGWEAVDLKTLPYLLPTGKTPRGLAGKWEKITEKELKQDPLMVMLMRDPRRRKHKIELFTPITFLGHMMVHLHVLKRIREDIEFTMGRMAFGGDARGLWIKAVTYYNGFVKNLWEAKTFGHEVSGKDGDDDDEEEEEKGDEEDEEEEEESTSSKPTKPESQQSEEEDGDGDTKMADGAPPGGPSIEIEDDDDDDVDEARVLEIIKSRKGMDAVTAMYNGWTDLTPEQQRARKQAYRSTLPKEKKDEAPKEQTVAVRTTFTHKQRAWTVEPGNNLVVRQPMPTGANLAWVKALPLSAKHIIRASRRNNKNQFEWLFFVVFREGSTGPLQSLPITGELDTCIWTHLLATGQISESDILERKNKSELGQPMVSGKFYASLLDTSTKQNKGTKRKAGDSVDATAPNVVEQLKDDSNWDVTASPPGFSEQLKKLKDAELKQLWKHYDELRRTTVTDTKAFMKHKALVMKLTLIIKEAGDRAKRQKTTASASSSSTV